MDKNRDRYYESKQEIILISKKLIELISEFDPHIAWANLDPKKSIFRINRYRRFWKNKSPYKENFGISISPLSMLATTSIYNHDENQVYDDESGHLAKKLSS